MLLHHIFKNKICLKTMNGLIYKSSKEGLYYKKNEYKGIIQVCVHSFYWDSLGLKRKIQLGREGTLNFCRVDMLFLTFWHITHTHTPKIVKILPQTNFSGPKNFPKITFNETP